MPGDHLEFELRTTNDPRAIGTVEVFVGEVLRHTSLDAVHLAELSELIMTAIRDAFAHAYPVGETGPIVISSSQGGGCLEVDVRDFGLPQNVRQLEDALHSADAGLRRRILGLDWAHRADEVHWTSHGPDGKSLHIVKRLHDTHIISLSGELAPFEEKPPIAPEQNYTIRRLQPSEAVQVSQLIYQAYGSSYFNRDVYYPERVAASNASGDVVSFVAADAEGRVVGHYALEFNQDGPVAEGGQAVVDPAHRGRGILDRLKEAAIEEARNQGLAGMFGDAVTVHVFTQKANIRHGAKLACVNLGIAPQSEQFKGVASADQVQRITCLLYFLWLHPPSTRTIYAPLRHRNVLEKLYAHLECPVVFGDVESNPAPANDHGELAVRLDTGAAKAFLRVFRIGIDTSAAIRHAKRELIEHSHAEALFVELPLEQPGADGVAEILEKEGFSFAGIAPCFSNGGDLLRMVYLTTELRREPILTADEFGRWLVDYAFSERRRVMTA